LIKFYIFLIFSFIIATKSYSTNVAVIDVNFLINNSNHFIEVSKKINNSQIKFKEKFNKEEENLFKIKEELEDLKLILSEDEFNLKKNIYYEKVTKFENDVSNFNNHYENEIINIKNIIFSKISELIQEYASSNQIDLILEKNQYLIAAEKINISQTIFEKLNETKIELKFKDYEN
tara:strand:- start:1318 stop:1845 length:528 start_codon:yes stop_codon:yes gene_type:complete